MNTVTILKPSSLGVFSTPSNDSSLKAETPVAAQISLFSGKLSVVSCLYFFCVLYSIFCVLSFVIIFLLQAVLENVKKCKNFLSMLIKLACSGSQSPEMGQSVKKLVEQLLVS